MTVLHEDQYMRVELTKRGSIKTIIKYGNEEGPSSEVFVRVGSSERSIHVIAGDDETKVEPFSFESKPTTRFTKCST